MLQHIARSALANSQFPYTKVHQALHKDAHEAPIPVLNSKEREAVQHAVRALCASLSRSVPGDDRKNEMRYILCGCYILQHEMQRARSELELLAKTLRPRREQAALPHQAKLNANVLGTLAWLTSALGDINASTRYMAWRSDLPT